MLAGSAGAVPIIVRQVRALPPRDGACLFVIYHRGGTTPFPLERLVADESGYVARAAESGIPVEPGHVYYPHLSDDLAVEDGRLLVTPPRARMRPNIDRLLSSLATEYGDAVTAVLLSGAASDGVRGLAAVREHGGITVAQDPADAQFPELPKAAVRAGVVDAVLPEARIHDAVSALLHPADRPAADAWMPAAASRQP